MIMYIYYFSSNHPRADLKGKVLYDIWSDPGYTYPLNLLQDYELVVGDIVYTTLDKSDFRWST